MKSLPLNNYEFLGASIERDRVKKGYHLEIKIFWS